MADFSRGLMAGFTFVDGLRGRAEQRRMNDARLDLAQQGEDRAQRAFGLREEEFGLRKAAGEAASQRMSSTDAANRAFARVQNVGIANATPEEMAALEQGAAFNPNIGAFLNEQRLTRRDTEAIGGLRSLSAQPQATAQPGVPAPQSPSGPVAETGSPFGAASPDEGAFPEAQTGVVTRPRFMIERQLGTDLPDDAVDTFGFAQVPEAFMNELSAAQDLPVVEREQVLKRLREEATGLQQTVSFTKQQAEMARTDVQAWQAALDPDNQGGSALRDMATTDPSIITNKLHQDWKTIEEQDPNLIGALSREFSGVVQESLRNTMASMRALPVNEQGEVDMSTPEAKKARRDLNNGLRLTEQMSDTWKPEFEANIRAGAMPIGNRELSADLANTLRNTPPPGVPASAGQTRANVTMGQRAAQQVQDGGKRTLSTKQVESLAWLAKRGYISTDGFEQFLTTGTFSDPADQEFISHSPDEQLWSVGSNGERELVYAPPTAKGAADAKEQFAEQLDYLSENVFVDPTDTAQGNAWQKDQMNNFLITLNQNPEAMGLRGWSSEDISTLTPQQVALLGQRYKSLKRTESAYEDSLWARLPFTADKLDELTDENGNQIGFSNFDDLARERGIDVPPLPTPRADVAGARMQLRISNDPWDRFFEAVSEDQELENAILESQVEATNP